MISKTIGFRGTNQFSDKPISWVSWGIFLACHSFSSNHTSRTATQHGAVAVLGCSHPALGAPKHHRLARAFQGVAWVHWLGWRDFLPESLWVAKERLRLLRSFPIQIRVVSWTFKLKHIADGARSMQDKEGKPWTNQLDMSENRKKMPNPPK